ncbi:hypothetical protein BJ508DRAFT_18086 [Ascobolus immersus RN42]|uniref:Uncharacterized protein n=1 Tax=Ascobolus immersus RN42 TaxID=1160509 RepID=A0A3N4HNZ9_ASCIM|nr:hypothetical protein BJ508DRAFT_18086 [Ascobolus immersus RN42]
MATKGTRPTFLPQKPSPYPGLFHPFYDFATQTNEFVSVLHRMVGEKVLGRSFCAEDFGKLLRVDHVASLGLQHTHLLLSYKVPAQAAPEQKSAKFELYVLTFISPLFVDLTKYNTGEANQRYLAERNTLLSIWKATVDRYGVDAVKQPGVLQDLPLPSDPKSELWKSHGILPLTDPVSPSNERASAYYSLFKVGGKYDDKNNALEFPTRNPARAWCPMDSHSFPLPKDDNDGELFLGWDDPTWKENVQRGQRVIEQIAKFQCFLHDLYNHPAEGRINKVISDPGIGNLRVVPQKPVFPNSGGSLPQVESSVGDKDLIQHGIEVGPIISLPEFREEREFKGHFSQRESVWEWFSDRVKRLKRRYNGRQRLVKSSQPSEELIFSPPPLINTVSQSIMPDGIQLLNIPTHEMHLDPPSESELLQMQQHEEMERERFSRLAGSGKSRTVLYWIGELEDLVYIMKDVEEKLAASPSFDKRPSFGYIPLPRDGWGISSGNSILVDKASSDFLGVADWSIDSHFVPDWRVAFPPPFLWGPDGDFNLGLPKDTSEQNARRILSQRRIFYMNTLRATYECTMKENFRGFVDWEKVYERDAPAEKQDFDFRELLLMIKMDMDMFILAFEKDALRAMGSLLSSEYVMENIEDLWVVSIRALDDALRTATPGEAMDILMGRAPGCKPWEYDSLQLTARLFNPNTIDADLKRLRQAANLGSPDTLPSGSESV